MEMCGIRKSEVFRHLGNQPEGKCLGSIQKTSCTGRDLNYVSLYWISGLLSDQFWCFTLWCLTRLYSNIGLYSNLGLYSNSRTLLLQFRPWPLFLSIIVMDSTFLLPLCISEGHYAQMMEWADNNLMSLTKANAVSCPWGRVPSYICAVCCPAGLVAAIQSGTQWIMS